MGWFESVDESKRKEAEAARSSSSRRVVEKPVVTESAPQIDKSRLRSGGKLPPPSKPRSRTPPPKPKVVAEPPKPKAVAEPPKAVVEKVAPPREEAPVRRNHKLPPKSSAKKSKKTTAVARQARETPQQAYKDCSSEERDIIDYELTAAYDITNVQQVLAQALQTLPGENGPQNASGDVQRALQDAMDNLGAGMRPKATESVAPPPEEPKAREPERAPEQPMDIMAAAGPAAPPSPAEIGPPPMSYGEIVSSNSTDLAISDLRDSPLFQQEFEKMKREHAFVTSQLVRSFREEQAALTGKLSTLKEIMVETQSRLEIAYLKVAEEMNARAQLQHEMAIMQAERDEMQRSLEHHEASAKDLRQHVDLLSAERSNQHKEREMARDEATRVAQLDKHADMKVMEAEHKAALMERDQELIQLRRDNMLLRQLPMSQFQQVPQVQYVQHVVAPPPSPPDQYVQAPAPPVQQVAPPPSPPVQQVAPPPSPPMQQVAPPPSPPVQQVAPPSSPPVQKVAPPPSPPVQKVAPPPSPPVEVAPPPPPPVQQVKEPVKQVEEPPAVPSTVYVDTSSQKAVIEFERSTLSPNLIEFTIPKERVHESQNRSAAQTSALQELKEQETRLKAAAEGLRAAEKSSQITIQKLKKAHGSKESLKMAEKEALIAKFEAKSMAKKLEVVTSEKDALEMSIKMGIPVLDYNGPEEVWV